MSKNPKKPAPEAPPALAVQTMIARAFKAGLSFEDVAWVFGMNTREVQDVVRQHLTDSPPRVWTMSFEWSPAKVAP